MLRQDEFAAFSNRVVYLHVLWHEYAALFRPPAVDTKLAHLNKAAPTFFALVQQTWLDQLFLEIGKLMDPAGSGERETLGVASVLTRIGDSSLEAKLTTLRQTLEKLYADIKEWRNKRIAHNDWKHFTGLRPLPGVGIDDVEKLIFGLEQLTDMIALHCFDYNVSCKPDAVNGGAKKLLQSLSKWQDEHQTISFDT